MKLSQVGEVRFSKLTLISIERDDVIDKNKVAESKYQALCV